MPTTLPEVLRKVRKLSISEAARFLNVSSKTLRRWEKQGILIPERTVGNQRRYSLIQLQEFDPGSKRMQINTGFPKSDAPSLSVPSLPAPGISTSPPTDQNNRNIKSIPLAKLAFVSVVSILLFLSFSSSKRSVYTKIYQLITSPTELHLDQQFTNPDQLNLQVLASETTLENYVFGINVPSKFTRDATFTTNLTVEGQLTAPNIIYSVLPGNGIAISEGQNPTISLIDQSTDNEFFDSIKVVNQADLIPNPGGSPLTFAAGSNVTLTTDSVNNIITISSTDTVGTTGLSSPVGISDGGTGITSYSIGDLLYASAANTLSKLSVGSAGQVLTVTGGLPAWGSSGGNIWTDSGTTTYLTTTTDALVVGGTTPLSAAKFSLDGDTDQIQLLVQGHSVQTTNIIEIEDSSGSNLLTVDNSGNLVVAGSFTLNSETFSDLTGNGLQLSGGSLTLNLDTTAVDGSTASSVSGLEIVGGELSLIRGCTAGQILKWDDINFEWDCAADAGAGSGTSKWTEQNNLLYPNNATSVSVAIGTLTESEMHGLFTVSGTRTGKALAILNDTGTDQNIFSASASGITVATISRSGNLALSGNVTAGTYNNLTLTPVATGATFTLTDLKTFAVTNSLTLGGTDADVWTFPAATAGTGTVVGTAESQALTNKTITDSTNTLGSVTMDVTGADAAGDIYYRDSSGYLTRLGVGGSGQILQSTGALPSWVDAGAAGVNYWQRALGALAPLNITDDLLLGDSATASALVVLSGTTGNADFAGTLTSGAANAFSVTAAGNVTAGTYNNLTLTPVATGATFTLTDLKTFAVTNSLTLGGTDADVWTFPAATAGTGTVVGTAESQALTNKTITDSTNTLGSVTMDVTGADAAGDIYYRDSSGYLTRLGVGGSGQILQSTGALPSWVDAGAAGVNYWQRALGALAPLNITDDLLLGDSATASALVVLSGTTGNADFAGTLTSGAANAFSVTAAGNVTAGTYNNLTLTPVATGATFTLTDLKTFAVTNSLTLGGTDADVWTFPAATAGTGTVVGTAESQALTNKTITDSTNTLGSVTMDVTGADAAGDIYYRDSSGYLTRLGVGGSGQILQSTGALPSWVDAGAAGVNYWQRALGALAPLNITDDLLLGDSATASALVVLSGTTGNADFAGTLTSGAANAFSVTAAGNVTAGTYNNLTLTPVATGATFTLTDLKTFAVTNSLTLGGTDADVWTFPAATAGTGTVVGTAESQALTNKTITDSTNTLGSVTMDVTGADAAGDIYYRDSSGYLTRLGVGGSGQILQSTGALPSWVDAGAAGVNYWQRALGALAPLNITDDLLLGDSATASALVVLSGTTGNADFAGTLTSGAANAFSVTAAGNVTAGTYNNLTLTPVATGATFTLTDLKTFAVTNSLTLGGTDADVWTFPAATAGTGTVVGTAESQALTNKTITDSTNTLGSVTMDVTGADAAGDIYYRDSSGYLTRLGVGGSGQILQSTGALPSWVDAGAAGVNYWQRALGALAPLNITDDLLLGDSATASALVVLSGTTGNADFAGTLTSGAANAFSVTAAGNVTAGTYNNLTLTPVATGATFTLTDLKTFAVTNSLTLGGTDADVWTFPAATAGTGTVVGTAESQALTNKTITDSTNTLGSVTMDVTGADAAGDIYYRDSSGYLTRLGVGGSGQILQSTGALPSWVDAGAAGVNYWQRALGALAPLNITDDLLLGDSATASALVVLSGTTGNADFAGTLTSGAANAFSVTAAGNVTAGTYNNLTLTPVATGATFTLTDLKTFAVTNSLTLGGTDADVWTFPAATAGTGTVVGTAESQALTNKTITDSTNTLGSVTMDVTGADAAGDIYYRDSSGYLTRLGVGGSGQILQSTGALPSWVDAGAAGVNYWQRALGALAPLNITDDLLLGDSATASALVVLSGTTGNADFAGTLTSGAANAFSVTAAGNVTAGTYNNLTLTPVATGATFTLTDLKTFAVTNSLTLGGTDADVWTFPAATAGTGTVVGTAESQALTNKTITDSTNTLGSVTMDVTGADAAGDIYYRDSSGYLTRLGVGGSGQILQSTGALPSWVDAGAAGVNYWQRALGALAPLNITDDLLLGDSATASALVVLSGTTGNADFAGRLNVQGVFSFGDPTPDGNAYNTLGTGDASHIAAGEITDPNDLFISDDLEIDGQLFLDSSLVLNTDVITDFTGDGLQVSSNVLQIRLDTTAVDGSTASSVSGLEIVGGELSLIRGCTAGQILKWDDINFEWDCAADAGAGSGTSKWTEQNNLLYPNNATSVSVAIGTLTESEMHGLFTVSGTRTGKALAILNDTGTDQNIFSASASGITVATISRSGNLALSGNVTAGTYNNLTLTPVATGATFTLTDLKTFAVTNSLTLGGTDADVWTFPAATAGTGTVVGTAESQALTNKTITDSTNTLGSVTMDVTGADAAGDIYYRDSSGYLTRLGVGGSGQILQSTGALPSWVDAGAAGVNYWQRALGALAPLNITDDLLLGDSATASALVVLSGTTGNADFAGTLTSGAANAFSVTAAGNVTAGTYNNLTLTPVATGATFTLTDLKTFAVTNSLTLGGTDADVWTFPAATAGTGTVVGTAESQALTNKTITDSTNTLGSVTMDVTGADAAGDIYYRDSSGYLTRLGVGGSGQILQSTGALPSWVDAGAAGVNYWQRALGALAPLNITDDLLLGDSATASALVVLSGTTGNADFAGTLTSGAANAFSVTAAGNVTAGTYNNLTLTPVATGATFTLTDLKTFAVTNSLTLGGTDADVWTFPAATAGTGTVVGTAESQALTNKTITDSTNTLGSVTMDVTGADAAGDIYYRDSSGYLTRLGVGGSGQILQSTGALPSWVDAGAAGVNYWQRALGALAPLNITDDLLLGDSATASALVVLSGTTGNADFAGTLTSGAANAFSVTAAGNVTAGTYNNLTLTPVATGATFTLTDLKTFAVTNSLTLGGTDADVWTFPAATAGTGTVVGTAESQALTNKTITDSTNTLGSVTMDVTGADAAGDIYYRDSSGYLTRLGVGGSGQILQSTGALPSWVDAGAAGVNYWQRALGALAPLNITDDLLLGDSATASALVVLSGTTGNADFAGTLTSGAANAFSVTAAGNVTAGTYNNLTLTPVATGATFTLTDLKTFAVTNSLTLGGTDADVWTFPAATAGTGTVVGTAESQALTNKTITDSTNTLGSVTMDVTGADAAGDIYYRDSSGYLTRLGVGGSGQILQSTGALPSWVDAGAAGVNYWQRALGALAPLNITDDLLLGDSATASALVVLSGTTGNADFAGTLTSGAANAFSVTAAGNVTAGTYNNLTLTPVATGATFTLTDLKTFAVTNSLTLGGTDADVWTFPAATAGTGTVVGTAESQALTNKTITDSTNTLGSVTMDVTGADAAGDIYYRDSSGYLTRLGVGGSGQILQSTGALPSWVDAGAAGVNYWQRALGALAPLNITDDLLLGDSATASALVVLSGTTGNADFAGTLTSGAANAFSVTAAGNVTAGTYNNLTLTPVATGATFTLTDLKTFAVTNSLTLGGTDADVWTFPAATAGTGTVVGTAESQALTNKTITDSTNTLGSVTMDVTGADAAGDIYYRDSSGYLTRLGVGGSGQILQSTGALPSWVDAGAAGVNYWQRALGALAPLNITDDLLLGDSATASALVVLSGTTGNADFAGRLNVQGVFSFGDPTPDGNAYNTLGTGDASHIAAGEITDPNDLFISDDLEIDGQLFLDSSLVLNTDVITDFTGDGLQVSSNVLQIRLDTTAVDGSTASSVSGLEIVGGELSLIRGCTAGQILKWDDINFEWDCAADAGAGSGTSKWTEQNNLLYPNNATSVSVAIGTLTESEMHGLFTVSGTRTGKALAILNDTGTDQNIFSASASGITVATISRSGNLTLSGNVTAGTYNNLTLTPVATGATFTLTDLKTFAVTNSLTLGGTDADVWTFPAATAGTGTVVGTAESQALTNKTITDSTNTLGSVTMDVTGADAAGDIYYRDSSGYLTRLGVGGSGQILQSTGALPSWVDAGAAGVNYWQRALGALAPLNITDDLLLGDSATASALVVLSGTTGNISYAGRLDTPVHQNNSGLNLPTFAGAPSAVTGTAEGDVVYDTTGDALYVYDGGAFTQIGGGGYSGWTLTGDTGSESVGSGNTVLVAGGTNGIDTAVTAADTVTLNLDYTEITTATFGTGAAGWTWTFNTGTTDPFFTFADNALTLGGAATVTATDVTAFNCTDCLNFDDFSDSLTLDASTSIGFGAGALNLTFTNDGSGNEIHNLTSTGDFIIQDNGTPVATFADTGAITLAPTAGNAFLTNLAAGSNLQVAATAPPTVDLVSITNAGQATTTTGVSGLSLTFATGDGSDPTNNGLNLALTSGGTSTGDVLNAINLGLTGTSGTERGINFADNNFDTDINAVTDLTLGIGGTNEVTLTATNFAPSTAEGNSLGSSSSEWEQLFLGDDSGVSFGLDQDWTLGYDEATDDRLEFVAAGNTGIHITSAATTANGFDLDFNSLTSGSALDVSSASTSITSPANARLPTSTGHRDEPPPWPVPVSHKHRQ